MEKNLLSKINLFEPLEQEKRDKGKGKAHRKKKKSALKQEKDATKLECKNK